MLRNLLVIAVMLLVSGCVGNPPAQMPQQAAPAQSCPGTTVLPAELASLFEVIDDAPLLNAALGMPDKGKLCQGRVYQSKATSRVTVFRAWNSTNPKSKFGKWWAFHEPAGKIATYRSDFEICYQWSPLDKLSSCTLKPGSRVVVGTGQSAVCSAYLRYPVSGKQQIFIENASESLFDCSDFDAEFSWQKSPGIRNSK